MFSNPFWLNDEGKMPEGIITDSEVEEVHAYAKFGDHMTKREVVNLGVLKVAFGYHQGHTARRILHEHGLIEEMYGEGYALTTRGREYLRAAWEIKAT